MTSRAKKGVLVVVHDAGGAEIIGAHIKNDRKNVRYHCYAAGPASMIFKRLRIPFKVVRDDRELIARIIKRHRTSSFVLLGSPSCWMTDIERTALIEAQKAQLRSVVYLEWWKDYRTIFGYPKKGWQKNLPDELWAGDVHALARARKYFPHANVRFVKNQYFADSVARYQKNRTSARVPQYILFMSSVVEGMEDILAMLIDSLKETKSVVQIRIRLHPGDPKHRYDEIINGLKGRVTVITSHEKDIVKDLSSARIVIGTETVALVVSALCKIPTVSVLLPGTRSSIPFREVIQLRGDTRFAGHVRKLLLTR